MLPFVPNVTVGPALSIFVTVRLATLVESDPWFVLSILLAYIVLFVYENLESDYVYLCIVISCFGIGYML